MRTREPTDQNYIAANDDQRSAKEKAIEDWLPISSSRHAKWWYSAFHNVTAMVGAGVLSLPYAMSELGCSHVLEGLQEDVQYGYKPKTTAGTVFNFFSALGDVAFAYAGHNVVLEIQATIPSTPERPSKGPMWRGVIIAYIVVALCYFPVALIGYQIYAMPVFDMIETVLVKNLHFKPSTKLRFITRNIYVAFTMFVGITFPFFGSLLGFFGGLALAPTSYFLPCIMWLAIKKPKRFGLSWFTNWICIILGVILMIISPIGGLRQIIIQAKDFKFYS
ncbi:hypothetical protein F0562_004542 [Nyssa sinensis]|uniref:Amino acid transporter transmembrane domain-containing protein n=1 Tax=Nyssa sinensis TaxID=561372 RepID=A0A5J5C2P4_9ASTE|nr:hypothetical protein F0562_004542 [Nyssa sinensis]